MSPNTPVTAFRLPVELLKRLDAYAAALAAETNIPVSRAAAVVKLLTERLDEIEAKATRSRKK